MDAGINDLDREGFRELDAGRCWGPVDADLQPLVAAAFDAKRMAGLGDRPPMHPEALGAMANQLAGVPGSKGAAAAEQIDRLQERGLAGAVITTDQVELGVELQIGALEAAQILQAQLGQAHWRRRLRAASASRRT